jgi:sodium/bile acid cotransporter 7
MSIAARLKRFGIDAYLAMLLGTVVLAIVLPASGLAAVIVSKVAYAAVALLFFIYGAKIDTAAVAAGFSNWRLQLSVMAVTFLLFPLLGIALAAGLGTWLDPNIILGLLFLAVLPSTVQSSIAFTSLAHGNVPAAICAASLSNLAGVVLTPLLAALVLRSNGIEIHLDAVIGIAVQILLPFILGQLLRRWIGGWIARHKKATLWVDRGSILLIVYSAFSAGMVAGVWQQVSVETLILLMVIDLALLFVVLGITRLMAGLPGLSEADGVTLLFCGSTKSLASGLPMSAILFAGHPVSLIVLPLMLFHQIQLVVCSIIAQRWAHRAELISQPA